MYWLSNQLYIIYWFNLIAVQITLNNTKQLVSHNATTAIINTATVEHHLHYKQHSTVTEQWQNNNEQYNNYKNKPCK